MGKIALIAMPYDSGRCNERMGRGPSHLVETGIAEELRQEGHEVDTVTLRLEDDFATEVSALAELQSLGLEKVRAAFAAGARPILLSGNCGPAALTAVSASGAANTGVIWFDAHADFNTPETSTSGFLDGMGLSILAGHCWAALTPRLRDFMALPEEQVILVGVRDLDVPEAQRLAASRIAHVVPGRVQDLQAALGQLPRNVSQLYLHVDVDVLDVAVGRANTYACAGGLSEEELVAAIEMVRAFRPVSVASITSYDPVADMDGRIRRVIGRVVKLIAR